MFFDTHAHYDDERFDADREELLNSLFSDTIGYIINPGCDVDSSRKAMHLAHNFDNMYFAAGIHPENLEGYNPSFLNEISAMLDDKKCKAVGEIGLDYYWDKSKTDLQKEVFYAQLLMSAEKKLPVIIHDREAHKDSLDIIASVPEAYGVFHCYSGSAEMAKYLLDKGWYLGFDGPVTYKNARKTIEVLEICPLDRILIETDSPYLTPVPNRGKRNDSSNLKYVISKIAEIKGTDEELIESVTLENAKKLFNIE